MFYLLSKVLDIFLSPLTWGILLCLLALPRRQRYRAQRWAPAVGALLLYAFSVEPVANALMAHLETTPSTARDDVTYDAVVLLGGVVDDRTTFTHHVSSYNDNIERLLVTYDVLRRGRAKVAVLSGGAVDASRQEVVEARVLGDQLVAWGIAKDRVIIEDQAKNTRENAAYAKRIADARGWSKVLVVTSAWHVPRSLDCFRAVKLDVDVLPVDYRSYDPQRFGSSWLPRASALAQSTSALRELFGRAIYRVQGYGRGA